MDGLMEQSFECCMHLPDAQDTSAVYLAVLDSKKSQSQQACQLLLHMKAWLGDVEPASVKVITGRSRYQAGLVFACCCGVHL
jgi:hypothetical protein